MSNKVVLTDQEEPYKAVIEWASEGVKITVECEDPGLPGLTNKEIKDELKRRAKLIVDHFMFLMKSSS